MPYILSRCEQWVRVPNCTAWIYCLFWNVTTKTSIYSKRNVCSHFWLPLQIYVCSHICINVNFLKMKCDNNVVSSHIGILSNSLLMSPLVASNFEQIKTLCNFKYIIWIFRHLNYFTVVKMYAENSWRRCSTSKMRLCCYNGECWDSFKDLPQRIESLSGKPLLEFIHKSPTGMLINKVPKGQEVEQLFVWFLGLSVPMWLRQWIYYHNGCESLW